MPPVLDPTKSKVDGLAFLGLSLTCNSEVGHPNSITHQEAFDYNEVQDRAYDYLFSTNDDGWLGGGGEPGPPKSYKLAHEDSSHVEIMRIGTYEKDWGGVPEEEIVEVLLSGKILIPHIEVVPTAVVANKDLPPELEIRFDMDPLVADRSLDEPLPVNWALKFIQNQLFKHFEYPSRFNPGSFHSTILRKAEFRSLKKRDEYFQKCDNAVKQWREEGPKPLNEGAWDIDGKPLKEEDKNDNGCNSGLWLFADRNTITHYFKPNFLPPYDTPEKRKIILDVLELQWNEDSLSWSMMESNISKALELMRLRKKEKEEAGRDEKKDE